MTTTMPSPSAFSTAPVVRYEETRPEIFVPRAEIAPSLLAAEADTLGWDCVNAIRLPQVNATMRTSGTTPATFDITIQPGWELHGTFAPWQLTRGGSGAIVFLRAPIPRAHMTFTGSPDLDVTDGYATVAVKLRYLPQPPAPEPPQSDSTPHRVRDLLDEDGEPQFLASDATARGEDDPAVVIQYVDYGSADPSELQRALFPSALAAWFNDNLDAFTYVFTTVNLNAEAAKGDFQWLKPTYTSYAYFNGATDETSYFGVLNLTKGTSADGLTNQLPPSAVPPDCEASILISNNLFLRQMIMPGLTKTFTRSTESDYVISSTGTIVESVNEITLDDVEIGGVNYTPLMQSFRMQIVGDELQVETQTKIHIMPGIDAFVRDIEFYRIILVDKPDGGQTFDFEKSREPKRNDWIERASWVDITTAIIALVGAVIASVVGKVVEVSVKSVIAVILILLVAGVLAAIPAIITAVMDGKAATALPSVADLVMEASADVTWPEKSGFRLKTAGLNGSLQLGGDLIPEKPSDGA